MAIDTAGVYDNSQAIADPTTLAGSPGSLAVTRTRPVARVLKEKTYRQALRDKQRQTPVGLIPWALGQVQQLRSLDAEARKQHNRDIGTFFQYYDGNEYGEFNEAGDWIADAQNSEDFAYSLPITPAHVDSAKTLLLKTALEYEYEPRNKISTLDHELAKMCKELAEEDMTRIFSDDLRSREMLYLLLAGKSYRHHYWARNSLDPETTDIPVYSSVESEKKTLRVCANQECGTPLKPQDEICPRCMSQEINTIEAGGTRKPVVSNKKVTLAENQMYVPNPLAIQHDLSKTNINQSFLIERDALPRAEAEFLYCQVLPDNRGGVSEATKIVRELERARLRTGQNLQEFEDSIVRSLFAYDTDLVERERCWLEPWRYANLLITEEHWYYTKQDGLIWCENKEDMPENAKAVKPNTFLGDIYSSGLFVCSIDDTVVEINGAQVSDNWEKLVFGIRPSNTDGSGLQRLRPLADMANDSTNLEMKVLMDDADPKTFLNRRYLSHLTQVGEYNLVDSMPEGESKDNVAWRLQGTAAHPALGNMNERIQAYAQFLAGTFSAMGAGAPDIKAAGTATGVVKMAEEASGRYIEAILQIKKADIGSRYKVLRHRQKNSLQPQIQDLKKRFGTETTKRFFSCNLRQTVAITVKKGTDQPQSQAIKLAQLQAYGDAVAKVGQHPQAISLMESFAEMINLPITVGIGLTDKEEANRRLGMLRELGDKFNERQMPDEEIILMAVALVTKVVHDSENEISTEQVEMMPPFTAESAGPQMVPADATPIEQGEPSNTLTPVSQGFPPNTPNKTPVPSVVMMQEHPVFMDAYKDWLMTEGARGSNVVIKTAVRLMWKLHYEREILKQTEIIRVEAQKQLEAERMRAEFMQSMQPPQPTPEDMAVMQQQQAEAARAAEDEAAEKEVAMEVMKRVGDEEAKNAEFQRAEAAKDEDLKREALKMELAAEQKKENEQGDKKSKVLTVKGSE